MTIRTFARYGTYTLINVFGLAIGIAASIVIFLYVNREAGFDRFHENADRIYRIGVRGMRLDNKINHAVTPAPLAKALLKEIDEVENVVRIARFGAWLVRYGDVQYNEDNIVFADPSFFQIFSFPLVQGNPSEALKQPGSVVITRSTADRYFGSENPLGKMLRIENDSTYYEVTGVMDGIAVNSHMHFDMVASLLTFPKLEHEDSWVANYMYTYFLAEEKVSEKELSAKVNQLVQKYVMPDYLKLMEDDIPEMSAGDYSYEFVLQPITDIYLRSSFENEFESNGNIFNVYLFSALAIVILVISCLNFVNLATARTANRAKEVSIRKIAGSDRKVLIRQFLTESSILAIIAMVLALLITELVLPSFNQYIGLDLSLSQLINTSGVMLLILLILVIGILSGLYPAFYLSSFDPVKVMRPDYHQRPDNSLYRKILVFFQFFVAIGMISMTIIIFKQHHFMVNKELGFNKENLLIIRRPDGLRDQLQAYKEKVLTHEGVVAVTNSTFIPGNNTFPRIPFYFEGQDVSKNYSLDYIFVSGTFAETYEMQVVQGRFFIPEVPGDSAMCVLNEAAVEFMGLTHPVGQKLVSLGGNQTRHTYEIIGVVGNVHFETLENAVRPLIMILMPGNYEGYLTVRLKPDDREQTISFLKNEWEKVTTAYPFVSYDLGSSLRQNYRTIVEGGRIFLAISVIATLIACLGLFSLVSYDYCRRRYEIGLRKVLGADMHRILLMQFKELLLIIIMASAFAWAGVFFLAGAWFNDIYYHITVNPLYFLISSVLVLIIASFSSGYQAYIVAVTKPEYALRFE
ncbi:MAG: ABC transporter permease [Bacteroidales bacterium]|nr:ABC transporter permease [Bacteroidales bacterium]